MLIKTYLMNNIYNQQSICRVPNLIGGLAVRGSRVRGLVVSLVGGGRVGLSSVSHGVDIIVNLHVALGELSVPVAGGVVSVAGLVLGELEGLTAITSTIAVLGIAASSGHIPIELVVRNVLHITME